MRVLNYRPYFRVLKLGLDDEAMVELMAVVDLFSGFNNLLAGLKVEPDLKPWYG